MATYSRELRRGLPRESGGESWPPAGPAPERLLGAVESPSAVSTAPIGDGVGPVPASSAVVEEPRSAVSVPVAAVEQIAEATDAENGAPVADGEPSGAKVAVTLRQGLPRTPGGVRWPVAGEIVVTAPASTASAAPQTSIAPTGEASESAALCSLSDPAGTLGPAAPGAIAPAVAAAVPGVSDVPLRRGLPRTVGGAPWPRAGFAPLRTQPDSVAPGSTPLVGSGAAESTSSAPAEFVAPGERTALMMPPAPVKANTAEAVASETSQATGSTATPAPAESAALAPAADREPSPQPRPVVQPAAPAAKPAASTKTSPAAPKREPIMIGKRSLVQWARLIVLFVVGAIIAAGIIVLAARGVTTLPGVPEFLKRYPGEYALPDSVDAGFPLWARWTHYLNFFFMVLIVRTGLLVRAQQKPDAFYTPKRGGKKVSIYLWLHTSLDLLWLLNGIVFVVLLFVSGHWARIVPTSWDAFPNAVSAGLQYLTLEWPHEDGWVNFNSLQQLMYFIVVFIAAPLAAISGVRMSEWWPQNAERLNKVYPAPLARAIHFPTMLFFVLFVIVHVFLVFATGALRNLNHMFAGSDDVSWAGFGWFAGGFVVAAGVLAAARPLILAPIAGLFGKISNR